MNKNLLIKLLEKTSISGEEFRVKDIIIEELNKLGFLVEEDSIGNISAVRGVAKAYPLLNAHMDIVDISLRSYSSYGYSERNSLCSSCSLFNTCYAEAIQETVNDFVDEGFLLDEEEAIKEATEYVKSFSLDPICAYYQTESNESITGIEKDTIEKELTEDAKIIEVKGTLRLKEGIDDRVLGGDDKCGIFIALEIAKNNISMPMKLLFTVEEEIGCIGISHFIKHNKDFFADVAYSLTIDRKGSGDLLHKQLGVKSCNSRFAGILAIHGLNAGIDVNITDGNVADVIYIRDEVPQSVNMSAGYYSAHTSSEYIVLSDVRRIITWVNNIVNDKNLLKLSKKVI